MLTHRSTSIYLFSCIAGYGRPASGYMGVGLAWPTQNLEALSVEISRLADAKVGRLVGRYGRSASGYM